jgi:hypothetical protein
MGQGIKNFFRILEKSKKRLRAFAQQALHTFVLNNCLCPEFKTLSCIRLHRKARLKNV